MRFHLLPFFARKERRDGGTTYCMYYTVMASCGMGCHACLASICAIPGDPSPPNHGIWWYYSFSTEVDRPGTLPSVLEMQTIE
jgi:hypothetical protein